MISWLLIVLALCFLGCGFINTPGLGEYRYTLHLEERNNQAPKRIINLWIDQNFGAADLVSINEAVGQWNYALNGYIVLNIVDTHFDMEVVKINQQIRDNGWLVMKLNSKEASVNFIPEVGNGFYCIGFAERIGGNHLYLVRDRLQNEEVMGVALHEIGHLLGATHINSGLMRPHFTRLTAQCIDRDSLLKVAEYQKLEIDKLNWCVANTQ